MRTSQAIVIAAALLALPCVAQAQVQGRSFKHSQWTPDAPPSSGAASAPGVGSSSSFSGTATTAELPKEPEKPKEQGVWKYAYDGHNEQTCTAGFGVMQGSLGCYIGENAVDASQCSGARPMYDTCKWNGYGFGNCPTDVAWTSSVGQKSFVASVAWFYDWKGTCYPSTITPYR